MGVNQLDTAMRKEYKLVQKYNIDIDVWTDKDGGGIFEKLPDCGLSKDLVRLYFLGKLDRVWQYWNSEKYFAKAKDGSVIYSDNGNMTAAEIEAIMDDKRGGRRTGAGRKKKNGMFTTTMRVPSILKGDIECLIEMYANWLHHNDVNEYEYKTTEKKRLEAISTLKCALKNEEECIAYRRRKAAEAKRNESCQ